MSSNAFPTDVPDNCALGRLQEHFSEMNVCQHGQPVFCVVLWTILFVIGSEFLVMVRLV